jgi:lipoate-protein ligase A
MKKENSTPAVTKSVYRSDSFDPSENLGFEEYLMSICEEDEVILYLWQNRKTIVIGKHQNPYKECDLAKLERDHIHLVRRKTGGGAVFHDLGNLNFTFIAHHKHYDQDRHFQVILEALRPWGIEAVPTGRNDITVDGKKFSGNAFQYHQNVNCHHGTLLVDVNLQELGQYLTPPAIKLSGRGINSVRARVVNLKELNADLTIAGLKTTLEETFDRVYPGTLTRHPMPEAALYSAFSKSYRDWRWTIAKSPPATLSLARRFDWGTLVMDLCVTDGIIEKCTVSSDTLVDQPIGELEQRLNNIPLQVSEMNRALNGLFSNAAIEADLHAFIEEMIS